MSREGGGYTHLTRSSKLLAYVVDSFQYLGKKGNLTADKGLCKFEGSGIMKFNFSYWKLANLTDLVSSELLRRQRICKEGNPLP